MGPHPSASKYSTWLEWLFRVETRIFKMQECGKSIP